ncbi:MAG: acyltransferase family protein [Candidatus Magnetoglobus multicellularis str. Araruama]|uniref:Acyltransferase family protein n=1 Tax=Candidatus Magnetoglobus multicellularis str. Araruama TaxID=890399 RepID=A0A1V1NY19_9BACT|nr:MAG: acyltransferase family protein [Candidatus Magnetoglobus multicellularis str. Araruama]
MFGIFVLCIFHTAMIFVLWPFHIKNNTLDSYLSIMNVFIGIWHMPIMFFVAGASAWFSLTFREPSEFIVERFFRLIIPLIFGTLVLIPPQVYFERLQEGILYENFWTFYPHFFDGIYPDGNFSWHHLWFLAYLFVISVIAIPITRIIDTRRTSPWICQLAIFANRPGGIFLFGLPMALSEAILRPFFPQGIKDIIHDWANVSFYLICFVYGYLMISDIRFGTAINRHRRIAMILGTILTIVICYYSIARTHLSSHSYTMFFHLLCGFNIWCWMIVILAYVRESFSHTTPVLTYLNQAVLPFFIIHQTMIIVLGYFIVAMDWTISTKFWYILVGSIASVWLLYECLIRRVSVFHIIFGIKK